MRYFNSITKQQMESNYIYKKRLNILQLQEFDTFSWSGSYLEIETDIESWQEFLSALIESNSKRVIINSYENKLFPVITEWLIKSYTLDSGILDDDTCFITLQIEKNE